VTTAPLSLPDLRRRLDVKATAAKDWRFWGLDVQVGQVATLQAADALAKPAHGAPGLDGVTFAAIAEAGVAALLAERRDELVTRTSRPLRNRRVELPKGGGKGRVRGMPAMRDRVVQGALNRIVAPSFEADFPDGSFGSRAKRTAPQAVDRVAEALVRNKTRGLDGDLAAYFDRVRQDLRRAKGARRVHDRAIRHWLKRILKVSGTRGVPQGGVRSPRLSHIDRTEVDARLERATAAPRHGAHTDVEDVRSADALVILGNHDRRPDWLVEAVGRRLREALATRDGQLNEEKRRSGDLRRGESCGFLGFDCRRVRSWRGRWRPQSTPPQKARTAWLRELTEVFRRDRSQPVDRVIAESNPRRRGGVHDFRSGPASRCVACVRVWVERSLRRHVRRARNRRGLGGKRWSTAWRHTTLGLFGDDRVRSLVRAGKRSPSRGPITPDATRPGKPGAGNRHAGFEVAGAGDGPCGTAPVLDPTQDRPGAGPHHPPDAPLPGR
jgi:RNA-directed DNA polymerase